MRLDNVFLNGDWGDSDTSQLFPDVPEQYREFLPQNITKSKISHPYTYSPFLIFFDEKVKKEATDTIYSDRLLQWDYEKHNRLCKKHFGNDGQMWHERDSKKIAAFLSDWTNKDIVLIANIQYVNMSSGFPVWRFDFCEK